jgi:hypothetical protein
MLKAGIDKVYRDTILGHTPVGMDAHYMSLTDDDLAGAMDRFTAFVDGQLRDVDPAA